MYNYKGQSPHYCILHKQSDMVNVKNKLCEMEGCLKTAMYNYVLLEEPSTSKQYPKYCILHKEPDMVNMKDKRCICSGCSNIAVKKDPKTGKVSYCKKHMKELHPEQYAPVSKIHLNEKKKSKNGSQNNTSSYQVGEDKPTQENTKSHEFKYTVDNVKEFCEKHYVTLVKYTSVEQHGKQFIPLAHTITVKNPCGHTRTMKMCGFLQLPVLKNCGECQNTTHVRKQLFLKQLDLVSKRLNCLRRHYHDFHPDNQMKRAICDGCKKEKPQYLFRSMIVPNKKTQTYPFQVYKKSKYCKECDKQNHIHHQSSEKTTFKQLLQSCARSSRYRQSIGRIECSQVSITEQDLKEQLMKQNYTCAYSGRPLSFEINQPDRISIDRIDSNKGYTKDNIQFLTTQVNYNKRDSTEDDFMLMVRDVYHTWAKPRLEQMGMSTMPE